MNLKQLVNKAKDKSNFIDLKAYIAFCDEYLLYHDNLCKREYRKTKSLSLYQYKLFKSPLIIKLMYDAKSCIYQKNF